MRIFRDREDSLKFGLSFFLIFGAVLGSLFCNCMDTEMKAELYVAEQNLINRASLVRADFGTLFLRLLPRRLWQLILAFLISVTSISPILFLAAAGYLGFSAAVMVCSLTMSAGVLGIWKYILLIFPQGLFYVPAMYTVLWWMPLKKKHLTISSAIFLTIIVALGVFVEAYLNPWVLLLY